MGEKVAKERAKEKRERARRKAKERRKGQRAPKPVEEARSWEGFSLGGQAEEEVGSKANSRRKEEEAWRERMKSKPSLPKEGRHP